jgi:hypothetical protein
VNLGLPWLFASKEQQDVDPQQEHVAVSLGRFVSLITQFLSLKNMFQKSKKSVFWGRFPSVFLSIQRHLGRRALPHGSTKPQAFVMFI